MFCNNDIQRTSVSTRWLTIPEKLSESPNIDNFDLDKARKCITNLNKTLKSIYILGNDDYTLEILYNTDLLKNINFKGLLCSDDIVNRRAFNLPVISWTNFKKMNTDNTFIIVPNKDLLENEVSIMKNNDIELIYMT
jgi:hypothetical protein